MRARAKYELAFIRLRVSSLVSNSGQFVTLIASSYHSIASHDSSSLLALIPTSSLGKLQIKYSQRECCML